jgi:hypothetical protein
MNWLAESRAPGAKCRGRFSTEEAEIGGDAGPRRRGHRPFDASDFMTESSGDETDWDVF